MLSPELPCDEARRQQALDDQDLLDTPADPYLDTLARVVRGVFGVQTVLVSLIDHDRQWFKTRLGLEVTETPRTISFCGHAILNRTPLIVEDAQGDPRFSDNPVVTGAPFIRFYAGQPLHSQEGDALGTLCLIHPEPKVLSEAQKVLFKDMAVLVEGYLKLRHVSQQTEQLRAALSREERKAMLDPLTQVWNRAGLLHFLPREQGFAAEQGLHLGLLFCDLDHFKRVNDNHGHAVGDQVLWECARRIAATVRPHDVVTRIGGEEFVVLARVHDQGELGTIATRILQAIAQEPILMNDLRLEQTVSLGCALPQAGESPESALARADQALYKAKHNGRNRVEHAD